MSRSRKQRNKSNTSNIHLKHPTIEYDAAAYASGGKKTFEEVNNTFIRSVEKVDLAIRTIANIISLADMKLYSVDTKGAIKGLAKVKNIDLDYPNETDSSVDFLRKLAVSVYSQGAGLIVTEEGKRPSGETMLNFYSVDVARVAAVSDGKRLISEFEYTSEGGDIIPYKAEDCIYINDSIDPSNLLYSLSRLKSLNDTILMQGGIVAQTKDMLSGGAKKACIVSSENPISDKNMKVIKASFDSFMQSASSSSMFLNLPLKVEDVGNRMSGGEMLDLLTRLNEMVLEQFAIPPYLLGQYKSGANRNTEITYSNRIFFDMQLKPVLKNIEKQVTRFLRDQAGLKNVVMKFDYRDLDILRLSDEERSDMVLKQHKAGILSLNEARVLCEYDPIVSEGKENAADKIFMPQYLTGSSPISYNSFTEDLQRYLEVDMGTRTDSTITGNAGGEDNTNVVESTRGGENIE